MTRKYGVYTPEFKAQAISLVKDAKRPAAEVARELGISTNTLYNWLSTTLLLISRQRSLAVMIMPPKTSV